MEGPSRGRSEGSSDHSAASTGGVLAAQIAAMARSRGLPDPKAVVAVTPGDIIRSRGPNLADIPSTTLFVVIAAEHDVVTGDGRARQIYREATSVPSSRKKFVLFRTDTGWYAVDHACPHANGPLADGITSDCTVICPLHERRFALDTGDPIAHDGPGITAHRVELMGDEVHVALAQPAEVLAA